MPPIPGLDKFSGCVDHSHYYRVPDSYANKTVVVLGASASGRDISLELSAVAKKVGDNNTCITLNMLQEIQNFSTLITKFWVGLADYC